MENLKFPLYVKLRRIGDLSGDIVETEVLVHLCRQDKRILSLPLSLSIEAVPKEPNCRFQVITKGKQKVVFDPGKNTSSVANVRLKLIASKGSRQVLLIIGYEDPNGKEWTLKVTPINPFKVV